MDRQEIKKNVRDILIMVLKHQEFDMTDTMAAKDVRGWDSLSHMIIIAEIEKMFGIKFKLRELNKLVNMGTLLDLIDSKLHVVYND